VHNKNSQLLLYLGGEKMIKVIINLNKKLFLDEKGIDEMISEGLLLLSSLAVFLTIITAPITGVLNFLDRVVNSAGSSISDFLNELKEGAKILLNWSG